MLLSMINRPSQLQFRILRSRLHWIVCVSSVDTEQPGGLDKSIRKVQGRQFGEILTFVMKETKYQEPCLTWVVYCKWRMKQNHHGSSDSKHGGLGSLFAFAHILQSLHLFWLLGTNLTASLTNVIRAQIDFLLSQSLCLGGREFFSFYSKKNSAGPHFSYLLTS